MDTFRKWQNEVIGGFNENHWLEVDVSKVGHSSSKRYVDSFCLVRVIEKQGEAIGRLHQTIQNDTKGINTMSATMGGMGQDLHNMEKYMEYYASRIHQVDKSIEASNMFFLWKHKLFTHQQLKPSKRKCYDSSYASNTFLSSRRGFYSSVRKHEIFTITQLKVCKRNYYAYYYASNTFLYDI